MCVNYFAFEHATKIQDDGISSIRTIMRHLVMCFNGFYREMLSWEVLGLDRDPADFVAAIAIVAVEW